MKPRALRILVVDDRPGNPAEPADYVKATPLESAMYVHDGDEYRQVDGLLKLCSYWHAFEAKDFPDIVVIDVKFNEDTSSPLQHARGPNIQAEIPTGLSHAKAFAAVSRVISKPIDVQLYSQEKQFWRDRVTNRKNPIDRIFALLAAQEIAELAAMLGDRLEAFTDDEFMPAWDWLKDNASEEGLKARGEAISKYRKNFIECFRVGGQSASNTGVKRIRIPHKHSTKLRKWCEEMQKDPKPIKLGENDPGLLFTTQTGEVDCISLSSFFADVKDIDIDPLDAKCFEMSAEPGLEVWDLVDGEPQVGALVAELYDATQTQDFRDALHCLQQLPLRAQKLNLNLKKVEASDTAKGLAVLFRLLEIEHAKWSSWVNCWSHAPWDPTARAIASVEDSPDPYIDFWPLEVWLQKFAEIAKKASADADAEDEMDTWLDEALEEVQRKHGVLKKMSKDDLDWHLNLIEHQYDYWSGEFHGQSEKVPQMPDSFTLQPPEIYELNSSLGYGGKGPGRTEGQKNYNSVRRIVYRAFLRQDQDGASLQSHEQAKEGMKFLENFQDGQMSSFVKSYCHDYCRDELKWVDQRDWPFGLSE